MMDRYWTTSQFDSTTGGAFAFPLDTATTTLTLPDPLIDWLPKSSIWKKYLPTWHLVKCYNLHKHELAVFDIIDGEVFYDWFCKYCKKWEWDW